MTEEVGHPRVVLPPPYCAVAGEKTARRIRDIPRSLRRLIVPYMSHLLLRQRKGMFAHIDQAPARSDVHPQVAVDTAPPNAPHKAISRIREIKEKIDRLDVKRLVFNFWDADIVSKGEIRNLIDPSFQLSGTIRGINLQDLGSANVEVEASGTSPLWQDLQATGGEPRGARRGRPRRDRRWD